MKSRFGLERLPGNDGLPFGVGSDDHRNSLPQGGGQKRCLWKPCEATTHPNAETRACRAALPISRRGNLHLLPREKADNLGQMPLVLFQKYPTKQ
jgi:hypothetical protein